MTSSKPRKSVREAAVDSLSRRALTHYELETRLRDKGYEDSEINLELKRLEKLGYLNDQEIALAVSQNRLKRYSRRRVLQDMEKRGLPSPFIEQAMECNYSYDDEYQQCLDLAKQWWIREGKRWEESTQQDKLKHSIPGELWLHPKIARRLRQRGYPSDMIRSALRELVQLKLSERDSTPPEVYDPHF